MTKSHVVGWESEMPTPAQLKELFAQIESKRITKSRVQEILRGKREIEPFTLMIDHDKTIKELIERGGYDNWDWRINSENFEIPNVVGCVERTLYLVYTHRGVTSDQALEEIRRWGLRSAGVEDILTFGAMCPEIQRQTMIVALGSRCLDDDGGENIICLSGNDKYRRLSLGWYLRNWGYNCAFLARR